MSWNLSISALLISAVPISHGNNFYSPRLEPLLGNMHDETGIHIQVESGGCTTKDSFEVDIQSKKKKETVYFWRVTEDNCLALLRYGTVLTFTYDELGLSQGQEFKIMNPRGNSYAH